MNGLVGEITEVAGKRLEQIADDLAVGFLDGFAGLLESAGRDVRDRVNARLIEAARFKVRSLTATDEQTAKDYADAVETSARRVRTILLAEGLVRSNELADSIAAGFKTALGVLADVAKGVLQATVEGVVVGTVKGFAGDAPDPSDVFPWS